MSQIQLYLRVPENFPENGVKMAPNSKFKNSNDEIAAKLAEKLISKFQIKILKNVGAVAILAIF